MKTEGQHRIIQLTQALLSKGFCTGHYALREDGTPCGSHCIHANRWDLAGALFLACEHEDSWRRDEMFAHCWRSLMAHNHCVKSPEFVKLLDSKTQAWHVNMLEQFLNPQAIVSTPRVSNRRQEIIREYA